MVWAAGCASAGGKTEQAVTWSYEVADTKLAERRKRRHLQLSLYSDLLRQTQGRCRSFYGCAPGEGYAGEKYPVLEYAAYYRHVRKRLLKRWVTMQVKNISRAGAALQRVAAGFGSAISGGGRTIICPGCGIRRQQRDQFEKWNAETMAKLRRCRFR